MKRILNYSIISLLLFLLSCSDTYFCSEFEQKIMERCPDTNKVYEVKLSELTDFSWDSLVRTPNYNYDDMTLYAFMKDGEVVEDMTSSCTISFDYWNKDGYGTTRYYYGDTVEIVKHFHTYDESDEYTISCRKGFLFFNTLQKKYHSSPCSKFQQSIMKKCSETYKSYKVKTSELTDFSWDSLIIIDRYYRVEGIPKVVEDKYFPDGKYEMVDGFRRRVEDNYFTTMEDDLYIFMKDGKVIEEMRNVKGFYFKLKDKNYRDSRDPQVPYPKLYYGEVLEINKIRHHDIIYGSYMINSL